MTRFLLAAACLCCVLPSFLRAAEVELPLVFEDDLSEPPFNDFKSLGRGESEWAQGKQWVIHAPAGFVRPLQAGRDAQLTVRLSFPRLDDGQKAETRLGLVYANSQVGVIAFRRERTGDKFKNQIIIVRMPDIVGPLGTPLRTIELSDEVPSGDWKFSIRAGAVTISCDGKEIGRGTFETRTTPIIGFAIHQPIGDLIVRRMSLSASKFPAEVSGQQREQAIAASQLNQEARALLQSKKYDGAIAKGREVIAAYKKLYGDEHHDTANALFNMATILKQAGDTKEAVPFLEQALAIRKTLFGEDHPDTAQLEMELTVLLVERKQLEAAFPHCLSANFSFVLYYGSENQSAILTRQILEKLPRPQREDET